jgi:hypothetical protein
MSGAHAALRAMPAPDTPLGVGRVASAVTSERTATFCAITVLASVGEISRGAFSPPRVRAMRGTSVPASSKSRIETWPTSSSRKVKCTIFSRSDATSIVRVSAFEISSSRVSLSRSRSAGETCARPSSTAFCTPLARSANSSA